MLLLFETLLSDVVTSGCGNCTLSATVFLFRTRSCIYRAHHSVHSFPFENVSFRVAHEFLRSHTFLAWPSSAKREPQVAPSQMPAADPPTQSQLRPSDPSSAYASDISKAAQVVYDALHARFHCYKSGALIPPPHQSGEQCHKSVAYVAFSGLWQTTSEDLHLSDATPLTHRSVPR